MDISYFTGIYFETDYLNDYSPSEYISCKEIALPYMIVLDDADDEDIITELCENMYTESAKCNKHMYDAKYGSYMVCDMIVYYLICHGPFGSPEKSSPFSSFPLILPHP